jgi:hypothetical protein
VRRTPARAPSRPIEASTRLAINTAVTVQRAPGRAKASTTLDTYAKLWPSGEDGTRRAASSLARQVLPDFAGTVRAECLLEDLNNL